MYPINIYKVSTFINCKRPWSRKTAGCLPSCWKLCELGKTGSNPAKSWEWFFFFLIRTIAQHLFSSGNHIKVIKTIWTRISELHSQQRTRKKNQLHCLLKSFSLQWSFLVGDALEQSHISFQHDFTQLFSWLLQSIPSMSSNRRFIHSLKWVIRPSIHTFTCS